MDYKNTNSELIFGPNDFFATYESASQRRRRLDRADKLARREKSRPVKRAALFMGVIVISSLIITSAVGASDTSEQVPPSPPERSPIVEPAAPVAVQTNSETVEPTANLETADQLSPAVEAPEYAVNPFGWPPEVWAAVEKSALKYDLPVELVAAITQQESHGQPAVESSDGYYSFGLMQPSLQFHFDKFAPYLEQAGLLSELTAKSADQLSEQDNPDLLARFEKLPKDWKSYQDIVGVLCDLDVNTEVGCAYLAEMQQRVAEIYPDLTAAEQTKLTAMAYNGGQGAMVANLDQPSRYIENIKNYWQKVSGYLAQAKAEKAT